MTITKEELDAIRAQGRSYADATGDKDEADGGPDPEYMLDGCIPFYDSNQLSDAFIAGALWQQERSKLSEQQ